MAAHAAASAVSDVMYLQSWSGKTMAHGSYAAGVTGLM